MPNFNEMVDLRTMVDPNRRPARHLSNKVLKYKSNKRRFFRKEPKGQSLLEDSRHESSILNVKNGEVMSQDENFRTFAPDLEEQKENSVCLCINIFSPANLVLRFQSLLLIMIQLYIPINEF